MEALRKASKTISKSSLRPVAKRTSSGQEFAKWSILIAQSNPGQRIGIIRSGVDASMLARASEYYEMPRAKFVKIIGLSDATADRKIRAKAKLGPFESERLTRIALIEAEAEQVFGAAQSAKQWLLSTNLALGESPLSMLDTDTGAGEVRRVLSAIAYGGVV